MGKVTINSREFPSIIGNDTINSREFPRILGNVTKNRNKSQILWELLL